MRASSVGAIFGLGGGGALIRSKASRGSPDLAALGGDNRLADVQTKTSAFEAANFPATKEPFKDVRHVLR
jgi:hypothetical protein